MALYTTPTIKSRKGRLSVRPRISLALASCPWLGVETWAKRLSGSSSLAWAGSINKNDNNKLKIYFIILISKLDAGQLGDSYSLKHLYKIYSTPYGECQIT